LDADDTGSARDFGAALRDWALPILATLMLAAAFGWDAWLAYQRRLSQEYRFLESHARLADAQLSGALRAIDLALADVGQRARAAPQDATLQPILAGYAERFAELRLVFVTDADGGVTAISDPRFAGFDASQREYFTHHRDAARPDGLFISPPYVSAQGVRVIAVSHRLTDARGRFAGVVAASLEPKYFESVLDTVRPPETGHALLVNTQGDILHAMPDAALAGRSLKGGLAFEQHMASGAASTRHLGKTKIGQVERVSVARRIGDTGLIVIVSRDYDEAMATWRRGNRHRGLIFTAAAIALFYLGWLGQRRQEKLARTQADLRRLIVESPLPMMVAEGAGHDVILLNRRFTELTGYESGDIPDVGHWYRLAYPDAAYRRRIRQAWLEHYERAPRDGSAMPPLEANIRCKDGTERTFDCYLTRFSDRAVVVFVDLTERKQTELQLRLAATVFESSREGVTITDLHRNIISVNPAFTAITGYAAEEVVGRNPRLLQSGRHDAAFYKAMWDSIDFKGYWSGEIWNRRKNGEVYPEILSISVVADKEGRPTHYIGVFTDISERKRAEDEIRQLNADLERRVRERTAELKNSNRELESFSYSVSHDLRTPLRAIDGFSHVIAEEYGEALGEAGRDHLQRIRRATQKMGTLIDNLLDLARLSRQELRPHGVDLSRTVAELAQELGEAQPSRQVEWQIQPGLSAQGDPVLLKVALGNLLRNAWKFTARETVARIAFGRRKETGEYFVRDNGAGFDMAYADKLFQPFQRLHHPQEFEGTGIGLAIVSRIVRRHGGRIRAESAPGQGASFYFTLG
jgi:PAS domain S-box-containing protein